MDQALSTERGRTEKPERERRDANRGERRQGGAAGPRRRQPARRDQDHQNDSSRGSSSAPGRSAAPRGGPSSGQKRARDGGGGGGPRRDGDGTTRFAYKWTQTRDNIRVLSVQAFGGKELVTVASNGNCTVSTNGYRNFRTFQALNMILAPIDLIIDAPLVPGADRSAGYRGGDWKVKHKKHGWSIDLVDGMQISAFPNRDWKFIVPNLESLPEAVAFTYETSDTAAGGKKA